jgi:hypothetical protein
LKRHETKRDAIERAVLAVLSHPRLEDAAQELGISRTTLWRRTQHEEFQERLDEVREQQSQQILDSLQANALAAVKFLADIAADKQTPITTRVQASGKILDYWFRASHRIDSKARLEIAQQNSDAAAFKEFC